MEANQPPAATTPPATDDAAITALEQRLADVVHKTARRTRLLLIGGVVLALATAGYLGFAWWQIDEQLDAPTVVALAEQQAEPLLNRPATAWAEQLEDQAPALVDTAADAALAAPAQLSEQLLGYVDTTVDERMPELEKQFGELIGTLVDRAADAMEGEFTKGEMTDAQAEELVTAVADQFDASLREQVDTLYNRYTAVSGGMIDRLDHLAAGEDLTEKDELHRQLITSFLALLQRVQTRG